MVISPALSTVLPDAVSHPSVADSVWRQRGRLQKRLARLRAIHAAVGRPGDLTFEQATVLLAQALEYQPDLIVELGRGYGNSTAMFTEAANILGSGDVRVVSLCNSVDWRLRTVRRLVQLLGQDWLAPLAAIECDILRFDYGRLFADANRIFVFWDAHGFDIAECVLGEILPMLTGISCRVVMHDISDARYAGTESRPYGGQRLWHGNNWSGEYVHLGHMISNVEQSVAIIDFLTRNGLGIESATHSLRTQLSSTQLRDVDAALELQLSHIDVAMFDFSLDAGWDGLSFPAYVPPSAPSHFWIWARRLARAVLPAQVRRVISRTLRTPR